MTWSVTTQNDSTNTVIAPASGNLYNHGFQAVVTVLDVGVIQLLDIGAVQGGPAYWGVQVTSGAYSQVWYYNGVGECTLVLNSDNATFTLTGCAQTLTASIGGTPPPMLTLPGAQTTYVNAFTNAMDLQSVTLTMDGGPITQWSGSGEGNAEMADTSFVTPGSAGSSVLATVLMQNSSDGGATWQNSQMSTPGTFSVVSYNQRTVVSEDSTDDDWNDSALVLSWWVAPS